MAGVRVSLWVAATLLALALSHGAVGARAQKPSLPPTAAQVVAGASGMAGASVELGTAVQTSGTFELFLARPKAAISGGIEEQAEVALIEEDEMSAGVSSLDSSNQPVPGVLNELGQQSATEPASISKSLEDGMKITKPADAQVATKSILSSTRAHLDSLPMPNGVNTQLLNGVQEVAMATNARGQAAYNEKQTKKKMAMNTAAIRVMQAEAYRLQNQDDVAGAEEVSAKTSTLRETQATMQKRSTELLADCPKGVQTQAVQQPGLPTPEAAAKELHPLSPAQEALSKKTIDSTEKAFKSAEADYATAKASEVAAKTNLAQKKTNLHGFKTKVTESGNIVQEKSAAVATAETTYGAAETEKKEADAALVQAKAAETTANQQFADKESAEKAAVGTPTHSELEEQRNGLEAAQKTAVQTAETAKTVAAEKAQAAVTANVDLSQAKSSEASARTDNKGDEKKFVDPGQSELYAATKMEQAATQSVKDHYKLLEFTKLHNLGLEPGTCCKEVNANENNACLNCRCSDPHFVREANAHCTSCRPGDIFLKDVTGVGACQDWDNLKRLDNDASFTRTACPLHPYQMTKLSIPTAGFACYRWGYFKEKILAASNGLSTIEVKPVCKAMKQTVCGPEENSATNTNVLSRSCQVKKSSMCHEVWIEQNSFSNYFKKLNEVLHHMGARPPPKPVLTPEEQETAEEPVNTPEEQETAEEPVRSRRLLQLVVAEPDDTNVETAAVDALAADDAAEAATPSQQTAAALIQAKTVEWMTGHCKSLGGTMRETNSAAGKKYYCGVNCNPEDRVLREMLGIGTVPGGWKSATWCESVATSI